MSNVRMVRYRWNRGFWLAWIFLVTVVALGFFLQARTIDRLEQDEAAIDAYVRRVEATQTNSAEQLCGLLVVISNDRDRMLISQTFRKLGYECVVPEVP